MDKKVLIISDTDSQSFWKAVEPEIERIIGPIKMVLEKNVPPDGFKQSYDPILMDISDPEDLYNLLPIIHKDQPESRIVIVTSAPTWKQTREVLRLGAATLVRKSTNPQDMLVELVEERS
jgi:DNA-binding NarL/FixJ family response regulator